MLSPEELFPLYAELALGLAGFAGVVSAFGGRERNFKPTERVRFLAVVTASGCVLTGCFALFSTLAGGLDFDMACKLSGGVCLVFLLSANFPILATAWKRARDPDSTTEMWSLYVSTSTYFAVAGLYGAAVVTEPGFVLLVGAFSIHLLHGLWMFVRLLTRAN
jgi:hypothetical protein